MNLIVCSVTFTDGIRMLFFCNGLNYSMYGRRAVDMEISVDSLVFHTIERLRFV